MKNLKAAVSVLCKQGAPSTANASGPSTANALGSSTSQARHGTQGRDLSVKKLITSLEGLSSVDVGQNVPVDSPRDEETEVLSFVLASFILLRDVNGTSTALHALECLKALLHRMSSVDSTFATFLPEQRPDVCKMALFSDLQTFVKRHDRLARLAEGASQVLRMWCSAIATLVLQPVSRSASIRNLIQSARSALCRAVKELLPSTPHAAHLIAAGLTELAVVMPPGQHQEHQYWWPSCPWELLMSTSLHATQRRAQGMRCLPRKEFPPCSIESVVQQICCNPLGASLALRLMSVLQTQEYRSPASAVQIAAKCLQAPPTSVSTSVAPSEHVATKQVMALFVKLLEENKGSPWAQTASTKAIRTMQVDQNNAKLILQLGRVSSLDENTYMSSVEQVCDTARRQKWASTESGATTLMELATMLHSDMGEHRGAFELALMAVQAPRPAESPSAASLQHRLQSLKRSTKLLVSQGSMTAADRKQQLRPLKLQLEQMKRPAVAGVAISLIVKVCEGAPKGTAWLKEATGRLLAVVLGTDPHVRLSEFHQGYWTKFQHKMVPEGEVHCPIVAQAWPHRPHLMAP